MHSLHRCDGELVTCTTAITEHGCIHLHNFAFQQQRVVQLLTVIEVVQNVVLSEEIQCKGHHIILVWVSYISCI